MILVAGLANLNDGSSDSLSLSLSVAIDCEQFDVHFIPA